MLPIWIKTGFAPAGPLGSDARILLTSPLDAFMRENGLTCMWDDGIKPGGLPWIRTGAQSGSPVKFKEERGRIEAVFGQIKGKFPYFRHAHTNDLTEKVAQAFDQKFHTAVSFFHLDKMAQADVKIAQGVKRTDDVTRLYER